VGPQAMNPIYCGPRVNIGSANVVELPQHLRLNPEAAEASRSVFGLSLAFVDPCIQVRESTRTQEQIDTVPDNNVDLPVSAGIQSDTHLAVNLEGVVETEELLSEPKPTSNETTDQDHREQSALATSDPSEEVEYCFMYIITLAVFASTHHLLFYIDSNSDKHSLTYSSHIIQLLPYRVRNSPNPSLL